MYHQFNIQQSYVLPTQCIYVFVWIKEQTAIISLYSINWLVSITETQCVYCAVRTEYLYMSGQLSSSEHVMHQVTSHRRTTA